MREEHSSHLDPQAVCRLRRILHAMLVGLAAILVVIASLLYAREAKAGGKRVIPERGCDALGYCNQRYQSDHRRDQRKAERQRRKQQRERAERQRQRDQNRKSQQDAPVIYVFPQLQRQPNTGWNGGRNNGYRQPLLEDGAIAPPGGLPGYQRSSWPPDANRCTVYPEYIWNDGNTKYWSSVCLTYSKGVMAYRSSDGWWWIYTGQ